MKTQVKIYVGTYAKYNDGSIKGDWFDLADYSDAAELMEAVRQFHDDEEEPEFMIQDIDTEHKFIRNAIAESMSEDELPELYDKIEAMENSYLDIDVFDAYSKAFGYSLGEIKVSDVEDAYSGEYESDEAFAEETAEQCGYEIPNQWPFRCIDWEYAARELMWDYTEQNGHYFRNC